MYTVGVDEVTYSDLTRAAVVEVLERWTSLTAILVSWSLTRPSAVGELGSSFGLHSQTLPQLPNPISSTNCSLSDKTDSWREVSLQHRETRRRVTLVGEGEDVSSALVWMRVVHGGTRQEEERRSVTLMGVERAHVMGA